MTISDLQKGQKAKIIDVSSYDIPLKLLEMGCLPGNNVELLQIAPLSDPLYLNINGSHVAIRKDIATLIKIETIDE